MITMDLIYTILIHETIHNCTCSYLWEVSRYSFCFCNKGTTSSRSSASVSVHMSWKQIIQSSAHNYICKKKSRFLEKIAGQCFIIWNQRALRQLCRVIMCTSDDFFKMSKGTLIHKYASLIFVPPENLVP